MTKVLDKAIANTQITINKEAREYLILSSSGDARAMLNLLNFAIKIDLDVKHETLKELRVNVIGDGVSSKDTHYDLASAMIKSLRGSDVDAALYYLARLIDGGESVEFITRRLVIFASEDIGNANPNALNLAVSTMLATSKIGYPESRIILGQCVVYLASCPKSNSAYVGINKALNEVKNGKILDIPKHLDSQHVGYLYPHDFGGWVKQEYLTKPLRVYESSNVGYEKTLNEWLLKIKNQD
jgi:putative ATPase